MPSGAQAQVEADPSSGWLMDLTSECARDMGTLVCSLYGVMEAILLFSLETNA